MRGTRKLAKLRAGREKGVELAALPALALMGLLAAPLPLQSSETAPAIQPLKEAIQAGHAKQARFVLASGKTIVGRLIKVDEGALLIRRPSAGLLSLPLPDIVQVKIKSANGELLSGKITRLPGDDVGWLADSDSDSSTTIADMEVDAKSDKGGPLISLDHGRNDGPVEPAIDQGSDVGASAVRLATVEEPTTFPVPDAASAPARLTVTADETSESDKLMYFRLTLSEPPTRSILIIYTMINGSAVAPGDYTHRQGVIVFEPGQTKATVATSITNDTATEGPESFTFFVTGDPKAVTIEQRKTTATIADDDH